MALHIKILSAIAGSLLGLTFIFFIVSNAVPIWSKYESGGYVTTIGLWRWCVSTSNEQICFDLPCPPTGSIPYSCDKIFAARAFVTLACILSSISALCLFACIITSGNINRILLLAAKGLVFASLIMGIIGVAVGISDTIDGGGLITLHLGAAAIIGIIAIIINLVGAIVVLLIK